MPEETYQVIKLQAKKQKKPAAQMIRELLDKGLSGLQDGEAGEALLRLARTVKAKGQKTSLGTLIDTFTKKNECDYPRFKCPRFPRFHYFC